MNVYTFVYKNLWGQWKYKRFKATCDTDARFTARVIYREEDRKFSCGFALIDFYGNYIDL